MTNGLDNSGFGFGGDSTPEQTINLVSGQKILIEGKEYTVIEKVKNNHYKVLATDLANNGQLMKFGNDNNYATSLIATYLDNDYYDSLDTSIKNAIVPTSIQQRILKTWRGNISTDWDTPKEAGTHIVFIPSWDELTTAAKGIPLSSFLNNKFICLRDTYNSNILFMSSSGNINNYYPNSSSYIRPAFVIDLSKIDYKTK